MTIKVEVIPALKDNYSFVIYNKFTRKAAIVDTPECKPVIDFLRSNNLELECILNTHHHHDHVGCNEKIKDLTSCKIIGSKEDSHRIPKIDIKLQDNQEIDICGSKVKVMNTYGHTIGHISYYFEEEKILFCGDTLFSMGCGRLFEGSYEQMFESLGKIKKLDDETIIYCSHEYTLANAKFALTVEGDNLKLQQRYDEVIKLRNKGFSTIPTTLKKEKQTNPFLRAKDLSEFSEIRRLKDNF